MKPVVPQLVNTLAFKKEKSVGYPNIPESYPKLVGFVLATAVLLPKDGQTEGQSEPDAKAFASDLPKKTWETKESN